MLSMLLNEPFVQQTIIPLPWWEGLGEGVAHFFHNVKGQTKILFIENLKSENWRGRGP
jgi:hypothetical protein